MQKAFTSGLCPECDRLPTSPWRSVSVTGRQAPSGSWQGAWCPTRCLGAARPTAATGIGSAASSWPRWVLQEVHAQEVRAWGQRGAAYSRACARTACRGLLPRSPAGPRIEREPGREELMRVAGRADGGSTNFRHHFPAVVWSSLPASTPTTALTKPSNLGVVRWAAQSCVRRLEICTRLEDYCLDLLHVPCPSPLSAERCYLASGF